MKVNTDLSEILRPYSNVWVALNKEETKVVGSGATPEDAVKEARKNGEDDPVLMRAPEEWGSFVY
jgi:hypothetical protein